MSDIERNAYQGTITVMCEVTVRVDGSTGSDMKITRGLAEDAALTHVEAALAAHGCDSVDSVTTVKATATAMSIRWGEDAA